ncbi:MAG TPA: DUF4350 domain-containing protein [Pyrinomonadaceae bacterium]|nr:DUF4350 domain-containing protein [Pyrinomonadaceae bacterium]
MQGRLAIILTVVVVVALLVALNAASYVRVEREAEFESNPYRSTTNAGPTGTRALYDFLAQTGHEVARWTQPATALAQVGTGDAVNASHPKTFVVVGETRAAFEGREAQELLRWVRRGGRLVIIDRRPDAKLLPVSGRWRVTSHSFGGPDISVRADDERQMTAGVAAVRPAQPTPLTRGVDTVAPSRFAGRLYFHPGTTGTGPGRTGPPSVGTGGAPPPPRPTPTPTPSDEDDAWWEEEEDDESPPPPPPAQGGGGGGPVVVGEEQAVAVSSLPDTESGAPVVHFNDGRAGEGALLIDYVYGLGRIVVLSDPYIVSNAGLSRADNLQLATNVVAGPGGLIAFDEYHHGLGAARNHTLTYFAGTPVLWMFAQGVIVLLAVVWTRSRRFARPLPAPHVDRRSSLEFVSSMAELQQRARAYDLAIENVYSRTRRALARYAGLQANAPASEVAARVASRSGAVEAREVEKLMNDCEDAAAGAPVTGRKALALVAHLRDLEGRLGIRMRAREIRQAWKR